jgi:hypothetical protein
MLEIVQAIAAIAWFVGAVATILTTLIVELQGRNPVTGGT